MKRDEVVKLAFSWDRPLQLWGLVKSILDNTDLKAEQIRCICKSSDEKYRRLYDVVGAELGCRIVHQRNYLCELILELSQEADFVSLAVDDMMYFRGASFSEAIEVLREEPQVCIWSWRIGADLQPNKDLMLRNTHWLVPHATAVMPYGYVFHTDGSVFRKSDLEQWLGFIPRRVRGAFNLNHLEAYLAELTRQARQALRIGKLHAGPLVQACVTWQINKVSDVGGAGFCETEQTRPDSLREVFENGGRLDYSALYARTDWLLECNENCESPPTHVAATRRASNLWASLMRRRAPV